MRRRELQLTAALCSFNGLSEKDNVVGDMKDRIEFCRDDECFAFVCGGQQNGVACYVGGTHEGAGYSDGGAVCCKGVTHESDTQATLDNRRG